MYMNQPYIRLLNNYMNNVESQYQILHNVVNTVNMQNNNLRLIMQSCLGNNLSENNNRVDNYFNGFNPSFNPPSFNPNPNPNTSPIFGRTPPQINTSTLPGEFGRGIYRNPNLIPVLNTRPGRRLRSSNRYADPHPSQRRDNYFGAPPPRTRTRTRTRPRQGIPTPSDISNNTSSYIYNSPDISGSYPSRHIDLSNNLYFTDSICPIDQQDFISGDEIIVINHCHHVFKKNNLLNWFERRPTCPVCRYNILSNNDQEHNTDTFNDEFITELSDIISTTMQNALQNSDLSDNIITANVEFNTSQQPPSTGNIV